ncbi:hypothetical protein AcV5_005275 [Taiwanofungus camphoratus]|nr:hypothetical protein AcW2_000120 [Antrodia cinnamomea]KAI0937345.1 hypothetical protein AcV5_005275 [Antrodia cinnamomea]KAI0962557.1 hypothetical protein AcV7_001376 [Antrodia cinnamomea]
MSVTVRCPPLDIPAEVPAEKLNPSMVDMPPTPPSTHSSRSSSPVQVAEDAGSGEQLNAQKKKKKKKSKKSNKAKEPTSPSSAGKPDEPIEDERPPVLCISRNKHWRYISSYHGPWLQLPLELLESLLVLNLDPATLSAAEQRLPPLPSSPSSTGAQKPRDRGFASLGDHSPPDSPRGTFASLPPPPAFPTPKPGKATPPPIDPGVFRSVTNIRRLIDEASELSVRASSGLSAAALNSMRGSTPGMNNSPWATAHSLGINPLGDSGGGGRNVAMSAMRVHRLRALAVQKLAAAYRTDEIASSVMIMQGGSVFDDIAERVLRTDPSDIDARYVHFFHEKIPSRQLAESTTTQVLDELIVAQPHRLEFYRTRGIVHCFRDEYVFAVKDFTHAIKEARALRRAKLAHHNNLPNEKQRGKGHKKKGKAGGSKTNGQAPPNGTSANASVDTPTIDGPDGEPLLLHPSVLPDAPEPIEPQCLFLRAAAYLQHAIFLVEDAILKLEGIHKVPSSDGAELRLCYIENGRYGGVEIGNPDGPLGTKDSAKLQAYKQVLADENFREQIMILVKKSMRDHDKFLAHFDTLEGIPETYGDLAQRIERAFHITESLRPGNHTSSPPLSDAPAMFTTYHPLLVESHFSILLCHLMLGDFPALLPAFGRTAAVVDGLEGYPIFLPPRSMAQAEFVEILERLAGGWRNGIQPHSLSRANSKLAIEAPPRSPKAKEVDRVPTPPSPDSDRLASSMTALTLGINGSSSSTTIHISPSPSGRETPSSGAGRIDLVEALDCARILLAPVVTRQREKAERVAAEKAVAKAKGKKKPLNINIPLHGPRVEIVLAWLGAVHLTELDNVA